MILKLTKLVLDGNSEGEIEQSDMMTGSVNLEIPFVSQSDDCSNLCEETMSASRHADNWQKRNEATAGTTGCLYPAQQIIWKKGFPGLLSLGLDR